MFIKSDLIWNYASEFNETSPLLILFAPTTFATQNKLCARVFVERRCEASNSTSVPWAILPTPKFPSLSLFTLGRTFTVRFIREQLGRRFAHGLVHVRRTPLKQNHLPVWNIYESFIKNLLRTRTLLFLTICLERRLHPSVNKEMLPSRDSLTQTCSRMVKMMPLQRLRLFSAKLCGNVGGFTPRAEIAFPWVAHGICKRAIG